MSGQYPWQPPDGGRYPYGQSVPETSSPIGEPPRPGGEKSDGKSKIDSLREWISATSGVTGTIVAIIALVIGGSAIAVTVKIVSPSPTPSPTVTQTSVHPTFTASTSQPPDPTNSPAGVKPGTEVDSGTVDIPNGGSLSYQTGAGNEIVFNYYGSLGYLGAGQGVNLAVLNAPAPSANSAYQACESESTSNYTQEIQINTLAPGDTLCGFMPNNQVSWVQFLGTQTGQSAFDSTLRVSAIIWQGRSS